MRFCWLLRDESFSSHRPGGQGGKADSSDLVLCVGGRTGEHYTWRNRGAQHMLYGEGKCSTVHTKAYIRKAVRTRSSVAVESVPLNYKERR